MNDENKHLWDNKLGFWRRGIGCTLPREQRSDTCLLFTCQIYYQYDKVAAMQAEFLSDLNFKLICAFRRE